MVNWFIFIFTFLLTVVNTIVITSTVEPVEIKFMSERLFQARIPPEREAWKFEEITTKFL